MTPHVVSLYVVIDARLRSLLADRWGIGVLGTNNDVE